MASTIKVNNIQNQCGANIVNKCSTTITLGASGDNIVLACGATQSGFGRTGTVDWDTTAKTAGFTAVSGTGYFVNTTSGAITVSLPAGSAGAIVAFADYANTFDTNALTIAPNGSDKIGGTNANATVSTEGASTTFVYVDSTQGWKQVNDATLNTIGETFIVATGGTVTCCGDYKIHTFTGPGTFCVSSLATTPSNNIVDYLVVAGGGNGGTGSVGDPFGAGGGGAGGFRTSATTYCGPPLANPTGITVTATGFPISVGGSVSGSSFSSISSAAGGSGASGCGSNGSNGGSGGGPKQGPGTPSGNTPPVSPPQGNPGGPGVSPQNRGTGGGGANAAGASINGGAGESNSITGSAVTYAGGGGGGGSSPNPSGGSGGAGGGGNGGNYQCSGVNGTANTGGGGGGIGANAGAPSGKTPGSGGSGIVIIRYKYQ